MNARRCPQSGWAGIRCRSHRVATAEGPGGPGRPGRPGPPDRSWPAPTLGCGLLRRLSHRRTARRGRYRRTPAPARAVTAETVSNNGDPLVHRRAELAGELDVACSGIDAERRRDLRREQAENDAVLVRGPRRAVDAPERRAGALLAGKADRSARSRRPSTNHLNPTGTSMSRRPSRAVTRSIMPLLTTVLPTAVSTRPLVSMREQVRNRHRQVVIGIHQSRRRRDDPVAIVVGVVGERDVEAIAHRDERRHRVRR